MPDWQRRPRAFRIGGVEHSISVTGGERDPAVIWAHERINVIRKPHPMPTGADYLCYVRSRYPHIVISGEVCHRPAESVQHVAQKRLWSKYRLLFGKDLSEGRRLGVCGMGPEVDHVAKYDHLADSCRIGDYPGANTREIRVMD